MLSNGCILYPEQCATIWRVSFLSLFSCGFAIYRKHYDLAFVPGGVFLTSINYWRKPDYSWRRTVDMTYVGASLVYQVCRAYRAEYARLYYATLMMSVAFYVAGVYYYEKKEYWKSTYMHCMLHIFANISNVILYIGNLH